MKRPLSPLLVIVVPLIGALHLNADILGGNRQVFLCGFGADSGSDVMTVGLHVSLGLGFGMDGLGVIVTYFGGIGIGVFDRIVNLFVWNSCRWMR